MNSMRWQMLFISFLSIFILLGISAIILSHYYTQSIKESITAQLKSHVYTLLEAAEYNQQGTMRLPRLISVPALNHVHSGVYAKVKGENGHYTWLSASIAGLEHRLPQISQTKVGAMVEQVKADFNTLSFTLLWEDNQGNNIPYHIVIYIKKERYQTKINTFNQQLVLLLAGVGTCLLLIQWFVLFLGLKPLSRLVDEIKAVEQGKKEQLIQSYPTELSLLTATLNSLIQYSHTNLKRYRNSLGDLAHSLKTPVAVLQAAQETDDCQALKQHLKTEVPRIYEIITYQLKRAKVAGKIVGTRVEIEPIAQRIKQVMLKIYAEKNKHCQLKIQNQSFFYGDKADLMELLGNLMDNAWKYGGDLIIISAKMKNKKLYLTIEDNGQKMTISDFNNLLKRGVRLDEKTEGQGIGLNVVRDIVEIYQGEIKLTQSSLGGLKVMIIL